MKRGPSPKRCRKRDWDFVSYQPSPGAGSTFATDIKVISDVVGRSSRGDDDPHLHGLAVRSRVSQGPGRSDLTSMTTPPPPLLVPISTHWCSDSRRRWRTRSCSSRPAKCCTASITKLASGAISGIEGVEDLFGDEVHLNSLGNWVSGVTLASVILDEDPHQFGKPSDPWYGSGSEYPDGFIQLVRDTVAEVLG